MTYVDENSMRAESVREELLSEARRMRLMPALNTVTNQMLRVMNDPNSSFSQLFEVARHDQGFSAKIIGIANSAYYSRSLKIFSLQRALGVIGLEELRGILICLTLLQDILNRWKLCQDDLAAIWTHSLAVSYAARTLSTKLMVEDPEEVFTVSILHDIGKGVFYTRGAEYRKMVKEANETGRDLCSLEKDLFGIDHQEVGHFISMKWRFPEELVAVIQGHHAKADGKNMRLHLVKAADAFVDNRYDDLGAEALILDKERNYISSEVRRVSNLLGVGPKVFDEGETFGSSKWGK